MISRKEARLSQSSDGRDAFIFSAAYEEIPQKIRPSDEAEMRAAIPGRLIGIGWLKETGLSATRSSDEPEVTISDDKQHGGCRGKGNANMDVREWGGSNGTVRVLRWDGMGRDGMVQRERNMNSMKKINIITKYPAWRFSGSVNSISVSVPELLNYSILR